MPLHLISVYDPMLQSHRELRAALHLAERELRRLTLTPRRVRLVTICKRTLDDAKRYCCGWRGESDAA